MENPGICQMSELVQFVNAHKGSVIFITIDGTVENISEEC